MVFSHRFASCTPYPLGALSRHCVTALADGKVLVSGGSVNNVPTTATSVYDPATDTWDGVGNLSRAVGGSPIQSAARLTNGRVLMAIGNGSHQYSEEYDPLTTVWSSSVNPMPYFFYQPLLVALPSNKALVVGYGAAGRQVAIYDSPTKTWSVVASLPLQGSAYPLQQLAAVTMLNGKVLVTGGINGDPGDLGRILNYAAVYDPVLNSWAFVSNGAMQHGRSDHHMGLLPDGRVLISGGKSPSWTAHGTRTHDIYDPETDTLSAAADSFYGRYSGSLLQIPDGKMLWSFGEAWNFGGEGTANRATEFYNATNNSWVNGPLVISTRKGTDTGLQRYYAALTGGSLVFVGAPSPDGGVSDQSAVEIFESPPQTPPPVSVNETLKNAFTFMAPERGYNNYFDFVG